MRRLFLATLTALSIVTPAAADGFGLIVRDGQVGVFLNLDQGQYYNDDYLEGRVDDWQPQPRSRHHYGHRQQFLPYGYVNKSQYERNTGRACRGHQSHYMTASGEAVFICQP